MSSSKFLLAFLLNLSLVFIFRHLHQNDTFTLPTSFHTLRLLSSQSFKEKACQNTDISGYLSSISDKDSAQKTYDMLKASRNGENKLATLINGKNSTTTDDAKSYGLGLLTAAIPIAIFFIFSFFSYFIYCCCLCCKCCPCCNCCKRRNPVRLLDVRCPGVFTLVMCLGVIGTAIAALIFNEKFQIGYNKVECSFATSFDSLIMGVNTTSDNKTYQFLGINGASSQLQKIIAQFDATVSALQNNFDGTEWLDDDDTQLRGKIGNIYSNHKDDTVITPDPRTANSAGKVSPPYFLLLGPPEQDSTVTANLSFEFLHSSFITAQSLKGIKSSSQNLIDNSNSTLSSLTSGQSQIGQFNKDSQGYDQNASDYSDSGKTIFNIIYYVVIGILSFAMFCAIFAILGCCCSSFCQMPKFRYFSHWAWCGLSLFSMFIFLVCIILIPASIILMESCDIIRDALSSSKSWNSYAQASISIDTRSRLEVCLFQDGDINKFFNISSSLGLFDNITNSFNKFTDAPLNGSAVITNQSNYVNQYLNFSLDALAPNNDYTSSSYVLNQLNAFSDYSKTNSEQAKHCSISQDEFVFGYSYCNSGYSTHYNTQASANQNFGQKTCIDVADLASNSLKVTSRIGASFSTCSAVTGNEVGTTVSDIYQKEVLQLYQYKSSLVNVFNSLLNDYQSYNTLNNQYQANLLELQDNTLIGLKNKINGVLDSISNNETGLIAGLNCTFLKTSMDDLSDSTCIVFVPAFYQLMILILVCAGFSFLASISLVRNSLMVKKLYEQKNKYNQDYIDPNTDQGKAVPIN